MYAAIDNYHGRIENLILGQENRLIQKDWEQLKLLILSIEVTAWNKPMKKGRFESGATRVYQRYLRNMEQRVNRNLSSRLTYYLLVSFRLLRLLVHDLNFLGLACETGGPEKTVS